TGIHLDTSQRRECSNSRSKRFIVTNDWLGTGSISSTEYGLGFDADLTGDGVDNPTDNTDLVPRNTPENTLGLTASYTIQLGEGDLKVRLSYRYRDEMESNSNNYSQGHLDSIINLNGNVTYSIGNYQATLWGRNMTDEREQRWGTIGGITTRGWWNEPATYGFTVSASF
ncbi:MAG: hypothetical protein ACO3T7_13480, partial [Pseudomonadales bacterium]